MESTSKRVVRVGGAEINDYYLTQAQAEALAQAWRNKGYDDVVVECVAAQD